MRWGTTLRFGDSVLTTLLGPVRWEGHRFAWKRETKKRHQFDSAEFRAPARPHARMGCITHCSSCLLGAVALFVMAALPLVSLSFVKSSNGKFKVPGHGNKRRALGSCGCHAGSFSRESTLDAWTSGGFGQPAIDQDDKKCVIEGSLPEFNRRKEMQTELASISVRYPFREFLKPRSGINFRLDSSLTIRATDFVPPCLSFALSTPVKSLGVKFELACGDYCLTCVWHEDFFWRSITSVISDIDAFCKTRRSRLFSAWRPNRPQLWQTPCKSSDAKESLPKLWTHNPPGTLRPSIMIPCRSRVKQRSVAMMRPLMLFSSNSHATKSPRRSPCLDCRRSHFRSSSRKIPGCPFRTHAHVWESSCRKEPCNPQAD